MVEVVQLTHQDSQESCDSLFYSPPPEDVTRSDDSSTYQLELQLEPRYALDEAEMQELLGSPESESHLTEIDEIGQPYTQPCEDQYQSETDAVLQHHLPDNYESTDFSSSALRSGPEKFIQLGQHHTMSAEHYSLTWSADQAQRSPTMPPISSQSVARASYSPYLSSGHAGPYKSAKASCTLGQLTGYSDSEEDEDGEIEECGSYDTDDRSGLSTDPHLQSKRSLQTCSSTPSTQIKSSSTHGKAKLHQDPPTPDTWLRGSKSRPDGPHTAHANNKSTGTATHRPAGSAQPSNLKPTSKNSQRIVPKNVPGANTTSPARSTISSTTTGEKRPLSPSAPPSIRPRKRAGPFRDDSSSENEEEKPKLLPNKQLNKSRFMQLIGKKIGIPKNPLSQKTGGREELTKPSNGDEKKNSVSLLQQNVASNTVNTQPTRMSKFVPTDLKEQTMNRGNRAEGRLTATNQVGNNTSQGRGAQQEPFKKSSSTYPAGTPREQKLASRNEMGRSLPVATPRVEYSGSHSQYALRPEQPSATTATTFPQEKNQANSKVQGPTMTPAQMKKPVTPIGSLPRPGQFMKETGSRQAHTTIPGAKTWTEIKAAHKRKVEEASRMSEVAPPPPKKVATPSTQPSTTPQPSSARLRKDQTPARGRASSSIKAPSATGSGKHDPNTSTSASKEPSTTAQLTMQTAPNAKIPLVPEVGSPTSSNAFKLPPTQGELAQAQTIAVDSATCTTAQKDSSAIPTIGTEALTVVSSLSPETSTNSDTGKKAPHLSGITDEATTVASEPISNQGKVIYVTPLEESSIVNFSNDPSKETMSLQYGGTITGAMETSTVHNRAPAEGWASPTALGSPLITPTKPDSSVVHKEISTPTEVSLIAPNPTTDAPKNFSHESQMAARLAPTNIVMPSTVPRVSHEEEQYFEYSVFQKVWQTGVHENNVTPMEITTHTFSSVETANAQAEKLYLSVKEQYPLLVQVKFEGLSSKRDDHDCMEFLGVFSHNEYPQFKSYVKIWVERNLVSAYAKYKPAPFTPFISKTVYLLRLYRLILPPSIMDDDKEEKEKDGSDDIDMTSDAASRGTNYTSKPQPEPEPEPESIEPTKPMRTPHPIPCAQVYTTLDAANRAARRLQIEMSHEKNPRKETRKLWQDQNKRELLEKVHGLDPSMGGIEGCWRSEFNEWKLGGERLEIVVEKAVVCGPRNV